MHIWGTYVLTTEARYGQSLPIVLGFCWFESSKLSYNQLKPPSLYCALENKGRESEDRNNR